MKKRAGFSLLELMLVVVILAVAAMFGYPSYQNHVKKTHRIAAMTELHNIASRIEAQKLAVNRYDKVLITDVFNSPKSVDDDSMNVDGVQGNNLYDIQKPDNQTFNQDHATGFYTLYPSDKNPLYRIHIQPTSKNGEYISSASWQVIAIPTENGMMAQDGSLVLTQEGVECHQTANQANQDVC